MNSSPLWTPHPEAIAKASMTRFRHEAEKIAGQPLPDYEALWQWSVTSRESFWSLIWDYCEVIGTKGTTLLEEGNKMPGARWFPQARLNYAENLLRERSLANAIVFWGENKVKRHLTYSKLYDQVSCFAQALQAIGVQQGDRVAGLMPNMPETIIAMLATASLGAIWSSASPDFGVQGVLDRFGQIKPKVFIGVDGYWYNGKRIECLAKNAEIASHLPSVKQTVIVPYLDSTPLISDIPNAVLFNHCLASHTPHDIDFVRLPFNHPLFIMYSSGTTGIPKCIVHSHGGTLLQHLKEHQLHSNIKAGDRVFFFTTCGWMMWNWLASALASRATLLLYDGSPFADSGHLLFDYADAENMTHFGTSAKFIDATAKMGLKPRETHQLSHLTALFSTGSPLSPESFEYVYRDIKADVLLASISGGTDIISCFALGNPVLPVYRGELQCRGLGMDVHVYDDDGHPLPAGTGQRGELVCLSPFPVMPIGFWNDEEGTKYHAAYFARFPGIWCHGDFIEQTQHNGIIIHGRSDTVLNPGGVRIGTAEIYRQVEQFPEVIESLVIGQSWPPDHPNDERIVLFIKLRENLEISDILTEQIKKRIRENTTPRHVPAKILQVTDIPRTKSGKIVELAVRNVVHNQVVKNIEALANPAALDYFRNRPELQT